MTGAQGGWLRGIVKEVPSGDTVVIMAASKSGIPPEKRLTLSSLIAPKMVSALFCEFRPFKELRCLLASKGDPPDLPLQQASFAANRLSKIVLSTGPA